MKNIFKYIVIFIVTLLILTTLLTITAKIPRNLIEENIKKSQEAFKTTDEIDEIVKRRDYTFLHPYADAVMLNIIYCVDNSCALNSIMEDKCYFDNFNKICTNLEYITQNQVEGNNQYLRYWHGGMSIIRPILIVLNLKQIYILNAIVIDILITIIIILLIKKKMIALLCSLIIGLYMCMISVVPFCIEYVWTFYIMLITSIIAILIEKNSKKLNIVFFITGMITCFLDFLTTETITILVPMIIVLIIRYKEKRITTFKDGFKFVFVSCALWFISYAMMWLAKWTLASIVLNINAFKYVKDNALIRINGKVLGITEQNLPWKAIDQNIFTLYPLNNQKRRIKLIIIPIVIILIELIFIRKKEPKKLWISLLLLIISLVPYARYYILANHSYRHYFFTFRSQLPAIMAITLAMIYSMDFSILKKIKIKNKKETFKN